MPLFPIALEQDETESGPPVTNVGWLKATSYQAQSEDAGPSLITEARNNVVDKKLEVSCQVSVEPSNYKSNETIDSSSSSEDEPVVKKTKKEKRTHKHKKSKKKKSKTRYKSPTPPPQLYEFKPPDRVFLEELKGLNYNLTWRKDRRSDRDNYQFEALNKKHVAKYRTHCKVPMGVNREEALTWCNKTSHSQPERYYSKNKHTLIYTDGDSSTGAGPPLFYYKDKAFISVPVVDKKPDPDHNKLGIYDKTTELWSQGRAPDVKQSDNTEQYTVNYMNSSLRQKIAQLNSTLRKDPSDVATWIALVETQDELLNERTDDGKMFYTHDSTLEKKISIIDRALKENTGCLQLQLLRLELLTPQLDDSKLSNEWKNLLFTHVNDVNTWRNYIKSTTKKFTKFNIVVLEKAYSKCIKSLKQVLSGSLQTHQPHENTEEELLDILLELCSLLHISNHTEKCISILQSLIEYNWYTPIDLNMKQAQSATEKFAQFYDSGVPLFGEPGAPGWKNYKPSESPLPAPLKSTAENDALAEDQLLERIKSQPRPEIYLQLETLRQQSHWLPWKPSSGETMDSCDDPSRIVISDDVTPYLVYFSTRTLRVKLLFKILDLFEVRKHTEEENRFVRRSIPDWSNLLLYGRFLSGCIEQMFNLLTEPNERTELTQRHIWYKMKQVEKITDEKECKRQTKELRQYMKSLLSLQENRNNVPAWMTFIDILYQRGLVTEGNNSLKAMMKLYTNGTEKIRLQIVWKLIRHELTSQNTDVSTIKSAICWYVHPGKNKYYENTAFLKMVNTVEQHYKQLLEFEGQYNDRLVDDTQIEMLTTQIAILLLTISLKSQFKMDSLQHAINSWTGSYESSEILKKYQIQLYTNICEILQFVMNQIYPGSKSIIRTFLQKSLLVCPYSQSLLNIYVKLEESSHTITRLRQMFTTLVSNINNTDTEQKSPESSGDSLNVLTAHQSLSITAVEMELRLLKTITEDIQLTDTGISNRIRSICSRDIRNNKTVSAQLHLLYMRHEALYGKKSEAKSVFYSAIQTYPYDKSLYMEAIKLLPDMLNEILELCEEKKIRLHTMIDELDILLHTDEKKEPDP